MNRKNLNTAFSFMAVLLVSSAVFAEEAAHVATTEGPAGSLKVALAIAAGLGMALASFGGAMGQGKAVAAALEGIARNPGSKSNVQTPMIIGLALIESLVLLTFVIAIQLVGKI